jgi:hypothetical protein
MPSTWRSYFEPVSNTLVECTITVHDVDDLEIMSKGNFVTFGIMSRNDIHSITASLHDFICDDRDAPLDKWMGGILATKMLFSEESTMQATEQQCKATLYRASFG